MVNTSLDKIDIGAKVFKDLFFDVLIKNFLVKAMVFLKLTPGGWVLDLLTRIVFYYTDKAYPYIVKYVKVKDIKFENEIHQKSYEMAQYKLKVVALEKGIDSDEFKNERKILSEKQSALVIFNIQYN